MVSISRSVSQYLLLQEQLINLLMTGSISVVAEQLLELHRGQGMDIYWRDANVCPTEEEYKEMVIRSEIVQLFY